jgi:hypothetical protein
LKFYLCGIDGLALPIALIAGNIAYLIRDGWTGLKWPSGKQRQQRSHADQMNRLKQLMARSVMVQRLPSQWAQQQQQAQSRKGYSWAQTELVKAACGVNSSDNQGHCQNYAEVLLLSLTPEEYSSSSASSTGGFDFISPARSQQLCAACVGFVATAAAEAAIAASSRQNWQDTPGLSEANVSFCGG